MRIWIISIAIVLSSPCSASESDSPCSAQEAPIKELPTDTNLAKARELLEKSQFDAAEALTREFLTQHANNAQAHFLLGLIYFREVQSVAKSNGLYTAPGDVPVGATSSEAHENKLRASLAEFTEGAKYGRPSAFDLKIVALDYILLGDFASADKWLTLALQWESGDAENWYYLGRVKYNENRFEEAVAAFQKSLQLRPRNVPAGDGLGLSYEGLNRTADAIAALQETISWQEKESTKSPEPYIDLGDFLNQQGRFEEALPILQQAVAVAPRNIRGHEMLGKTLLNLNRLQDAQREMEAAVSADPGRASLHYLLGQIYRKGGQLDKAKAEMARFQELKAKEPPAKSGMQ